MNRRRKVPKFTTAFVTVNEVLALDEFIKYAELPEGHEAFREKVSGIIATIKATLAGYDEETVATARALYHRDGEIEIDDGAVVSRGDNHGAYVSAWVWVDD